MATPDQVALSDLGDSLCALRLCSEAAGRAMQRSLAERGQLTPVLCYRASASLELFDGFKRLRAARALGWASLRVEQIATDAAEAKLSLWQVNEGTRSAVCSPRRYAVAAPCAALQPALDPARRRQWITN